MPLLFPADWRFKRPADTEAVAQTAIDAFLALAVRISAGSSQPQTVLETFKANFARGAGLESSRSSSESWARSDLETQMQAAAANPVLFVDAIWNSCETLRGNGLAVPNVIIINDLLSECQVPVVVDPPHLRVLPRPVMPPPAVPDALADWLLEEIDDVREPVPTAGTVQLAEPARHPLWVPPESSVLRILFLAANPNNSARLALGQEERDINERIQLAPHRDRIRVQARWAVRPRDLQAAILAFDPHIVHFSGHGAGQPGIWLHGVGESIQPVGGRALSKLFASRRGTVRAVVLNACYSTAQAEEIAVEVDYVIGMQDSIGDAAAITFAAAFYQGLAFGRTVRESFELGVNGIELEGLCEGSEVPILLVRKGVIDGPLL